MCNTRINFKTNKPLFIGTIANFLFLFSRVFDNFPEVLSGMLVGIAIGCYVVGLYMVNHDITRLTGWKKSLIAKLRK